MVSARAGRVQIPFISISCALRQATKDDHPLRRLSRIRRPAQNGKSTIDLLRQHSASQLVRKSHGGQREQHPGVGAPGRRQAIRAADQEYQVPAGHFSLGKNARKRQGIQNPPSGVQVNVLG